MEQGLLYVGTYTQDTASKGIYTVAAKDGGLQVLHSCPARDPSFLALHGDMLYAANERLDTGQLSAYRRREDGSLCFAGEITFPGSATCHVRVWPGGGYMSAASYMSGCFTTVRLQADGTFGEVVQHIQSSGSGPNATRQEGPHAHSITPTPDGRFFIGCDLGADKLIVWRAAQESGLLQEVHTQVVPAGEGPRHLVFNADGTRLYLLTELACRLLVYAFCPDSGALELLQENPTLPGAVPADNLAADVHLSADGRFLYASNRGEDTLTVFALQPDGLLQRIGIYPAGGQSPRNFCISPEGQAIVTACGVSGTLALLERNQEDGALAAPGSTLPVPGAVCVLWP